jgi:excisionase family DNA binding protein
LPRARKRKENIKEPSALLSTGQVAELFGVHPNTIRRWVAEGKLNAERLGTRKDRKFRRMDVAELYLDKAIRNFLNDRLV